MSFSGHSRPKAFEFYENNILYTTICLALNKANKKSNQNLITNTNMLFKWRRYIYTNVCYERINRQHRIDTAASFTLYMPEIKNEFSVKLTTNRFRSDVKEHYYNL